MNKFNAAVWLNDDEFNAEEKLIIFTWSTFYVMSTLSG